MKSRMLKKSMFGNRWPFIPDQLRIHVVKSAVFVTYSGKRYNLNGMASNLGIGQNLDAIWYHDKSTGLRKSIGPVFVWLMKNGYI